MLEFNYVARNNAGKEVRGCVKAENYDKAIQQIMRCGCYPLRVTQVKKSVQKKWGKSSFLKGKESRISVSEILHVIRQMADFSEAQVPLLKAFDLIIAQNTNLFFRRVLMDIRERIMNGSSLAEAMACHPEVFKPFYVQMIKAGELSGYLSLALNRLAASLEQDQNLRMRVMTALAYPLLVLVSGGITIFVLISFIIPKLMDMMEEFDQVLPLPTRILMSISAVMARFWWVIVLLVLLGGMIIKIYIQSPEGAKRYDALILKLPLVGRLTRMAWMTRFCRILATLLEGGVAIVQALYSVGDVMVNKVLKKKVQQVAHRVQTGASLTEALRKSDFMPESLLSMIEVGEQTGNLEKSLHKVASSTERQMEITIKFFNALLQPVLILGIGSVIGLIVVALLLPLLKINMMME